MDLTLADAKTFLESLGIAMPDVVLQLLVNQVNSIDECLAEAGYDPNVAGLIKYYLLALFGIVGVTRNVTSQRAPSGAARSFAFGTPSQGYRQYLGLLQALDKLGCTDDLVPNDPEQSNCALFVGKSSGCC